MNIRLTIFDNLRKSLILTTRPFRSINAMVAWANTFIMGISPALVLLITDDKNVDIGYLKPTPNGYVASEMERKQNEYTKDTTTVEQPNTIAKTP